MKKIVVVCVFVGLFVVVGLVFVYGCDGGVVIGVLIGGVVLGVIVMLVMNLFVVY